MFSFTRTLRYALILSRQIVYILYVIFSKLFLNLNMFRNMSVVVYPCSLALSLQV